jgi:hypothetical protein
MGHALTDKELNLSAEQFAAMSNSLLNSPSDRIDNGMYKKKRVFEEFGDTRKI